MEKNVSHQTIRTRLIRYEISMANVWLPRLLKGFQSRIVASKRCCSITSCKAACRHPIKTPKCCPFLPELVPSGKLTYRSYWKSPFIQLIYSLESVIFHSKLLVCQGVKGTIYQGFLQLLMLSPVKAFLRRSTAGPGLGNRKHQQKRINNPKGSKGCVCVSGNG